VNQFNLNVFFELLSSVVQLPVNVVFELLVRLNDGEVNRCTLRDNEVTVFGICCSDIKEPGDHVLLEELLVLSDRHDTVFSDVITSDTMVIF
jgi:hypothetical protein